MSDNTSMALDPPKRKRPKVTSVKAQGSSTPPITYFSLKYQLPDNPEKVELDTLAAISSIIISIDNDEKNVGAPILLPGHTMHGFTESDIHPFEFECRLMGDGGENYADYLRGVHNVNVAIIYNDQEFMDVVTNIPYQKVS